MSWNEQGNLEMVIKGVTVKNTSYGYYSDGLRAYKTTTSGVRHDYYYDGDRLIAETIGTDKYILYHYDETDSIYSITYNNGSSTAKYYFFKNLHGDVIEIRSSTNSKVATYKYDPWGNINSITDSSGNTITDTTHIANINPIRYRSYYYDTETGFYYLKSRYYDPAIGRFISADSMIAVDSLGNGLNLFAYCFNNPIMYVDNNGEWPEWGLFIKGTLATAVGALTVVAVVATGGTCAPLVALGYSVLGTAGTAMAVTGASEVVESFTGSNEIKKHVGDETFDTIQNTSAVAISAGSAIIDAGSASICFVAGTLVNTKSGLVPIEQIETNDLVWAWDEETGEVELKRVVQTFVNESDELIHIFVNGEEIITTPEHPFYSPVKGWTSAVHLRAGDILVLVNGTYVVVDKVQHEILESPITVYNFEVEDYHTYYVGNSSVLVHNACGAKNQKTLWDIKTHAVKKINYTYHGTRVTAYMDSNNYYWSRDYAGHNSYYKVYEKIGNKLCWVADADEYGNWIVNKHKGEVGMVIDIK